MHKKIKKILVTGSSGMIGTALCEKLLENGYEVIGVDLKQNRWSEAVNRFTMIYDLREKAFFDTLSRDFDMLIHLAANARVFNLVKDPVLARDNFEMVFNVLEFCRLNKTNRIIFSSSREVYGNSPAISPTEDEIEINYCESPYAATKLAGEAFIAAYHHCYNIDYLIIRLSNVYGKYDESDRVIPYFIRRAKRGKDLVIFGQDKLLDFTYISDCINGIVKAIEIFNNIRGNTLNIASGKGSLITNVARHIQKKIDRGGQMVIKENRSGEVVRFIADIAKAKQLLNWEPQIEITEGLTKTIEFYNMNEKMKN